TARSVPLVDEYVRSGVSGDQNLAVVVILGPIHLDARLARHQDRVPLRLAAFDLAFHPLWCEALAFPERTTHRLKRVAVECLQVPLVWLLAKVAVEVDVVAQVAGGAELLEPLFGSDDQRYSTWGDLGCEVRDSPVEGE